MFLALLIYDYFLFRPRNITVAVRPYRISFVILMYNMYKDIVCVLLVQRTECTQWICYNHEYVVYIKKVNKLHRNIQHLLRKSIWRRQIWVDLYQPFRYLGFHEKATLSSTSLCSRLLVLHNETPVDDITKVKFETKSSQDCWGSWEGEKILLHCKWQPLLFVIVFKKLGLKIHKCDKF